jgi:hypothetical protein
VTDGTDRLRDGAAVTLPTAQTATGEGRQGHAGQASAAARPNGQHQHNRQSQPQ